MLHRDVQLLNGRIQSTTCGEVEWGVLGATRNRSRSTCDPQRLCDALLMQRRNISATFQGARDQAEHKREQAATQKKATALLMQPRNISATFKGASEWE